jgi:hypothetical protein
MTAKGNATDLMHFISKQMRMAQVYQPVMIKTLLANGGAATTEEIAKALLAYDQSQVEYYSLRTKAMVGKVLTNNGVVEPIKDGRQITGYRLTEATHTDAQRAVLQAMCDEEQIDGRWPIIIKNLYPFCTDAFYMGNSKLLYYFDSKINFSDHSMYL